MTTSTVNLFHAVFFKFTQWHMNDGIIEEFFVLNW